MAFFSLNPNSMKKVFLSIVLAGFAFSTYSCRETTEEKTEEAIEAIGEDVEEGTERAAEEIEQGAEEVEREIDEEIHETDDQSQQ